MVKKMQEAQQMWLLKPKNISEMFLEAVCKQHRVESDDKPVLNWVHIDVKTTNMQKSIEILNTNMLTCTVNIHD